MLLCVFTRTVLLLLLLAMSFQFVAGGLQQIEGVIFDLDGTLLDTETLSTLAINMVLSRYGEDKRLEWDLKKRIIGLRGPAWSQIVVDELALTGQLEPSQLLLEWEINLQALCSEVEACAGAEELTAHLFEQGIPMAIATSSSSKQVAEKRKYHESIFARMQHVVCGDDEELGSGKPAPDIFLLAAKRLEVAPTSCLAFEDALSGVQSAASAGMRVIVVPDARSDTDAFSHITELRFLSLHLHDLSLHTRFQFVSRR